MTTHRADESQLLDDRGYTGPLIRGQNPALLFEKGVRERIVDSYYWKEQCFGLNAASLCDRAVQLNCIGGTYGATGKPTPFICLAFKLLQLVPEKSIILEYLNFDDERHDRDDDNDSNPNESSALNGHGPPKQKGDFKYLRALAAFYIRLAWDPVDIYKTLEPLLCDYRKIKRRTRESFTLTYIDQFVDDLLTKDRVCATSLWKMNRRNLEDLDILEPRESPLAHEVEDLMDASDRAGDSGSDKSRRRSYDSRSDISYSTSPSPQRASRQHDSPSRSASPSHVSRRSDRD